MAKTEGISFDGCEFSDNGGDGLSSNRPVSVNRSAFRGNGGYGARLDGVKSSDFKDSSFTDNAAGGVAIGPMQEYLTKFPFMEQFPEAEIMKIANDLVATSDADDRETILKSSKIGQILSQNANSVPWLALAVETLALVFK